MSIADGGVSKFKEETIQPAPSPDGQLLGFRNDKDEIWVTGSAGESARKVVSADSKWLLSNFAWAPTGKRICIRPRECGPSGYG